MNEENENILSSDTPPDFSTAKPPSPNGEPQTDTPPTEPPRRRRAPRRAPKGDTKRQTPAQLEKALQEFFGMIAVGIGTTGDMYCAGVVAERAEPMAEAWADLARKDERVRRIIERMMEGSAWGGVIFATAVTVIPIAAHHGLYPKGMPMPFDFGIGPPPPASEEVSEQRTKRTGYPTSGSPPAPPPT